MEIFITNYNLGGKWMDENKGIDMSKYKKLDVISIAINGDENKSIITSEDIMKNGKITIDMVVDYEKITTNKDNMEDEK